jgi:hypothetical protein
MLKAGVDYDYDSLSSAPNLILNEWIGEYVGGWPIVKTRECQSVLSSRAEFSSGASDWQ